MSEENVEIVRQVFERFGSDYWRGHFADDVVWDTSAVGHPGIAGVYRGHAGVEEFFRKWLEPWEDPVVELLDVTAAGESVFAAFHWRARGRGSGAEVERDFFGVYDFQDGVIVRFRQRDTRAEALEDAGLEE